MSAKVGEIIKELNKLAPENLAYKKDNVGLQIGSLSSSVSKILIALDATPAVADEAIRIGVDMIITHHPMIYSPIFNIIKDEPLGEKLYKLIENNISVYSMHTNFDAVFGGTNDILANKINLFNSQVINPNEDGIGIGRIGNIKRTTVNNLAMLLKEELDLTHVRLVSDLDKPVEKVGICAGSGMSLMKYLVGKVDVFITGDVKYHDAQSAKDNDLAIIDVGHYGSENIAMSSIKRHLTDFAKINGIELILSRINEDPFTTI